VPSANGVHARNHDICAGSPAPAPRGAAACSRPGHDRPVRHDGENHVGADSERDQGNRSPHRCIIAEGRIGTSFPLSRALGFAATAPPTRCTDALVQKDNGWATSPEAAGHLTWASWHPRLRVVTAHDN